MFVLEKNTEMCVSTVFGFSGRAFPAPPVATSFFKYTCIRDEMGLTGS